MRGAGDGPGGVETGAAKGAAAQGAAGGSAGRRVLPDSLIRAVRAIEAGETLSRARHLATGFGAVDAALPGGGLAHGAVHELCGAGTHTLALHLVARTAGPVLWCADARGPGVLYGPGVMQRGVDPARLTVAVCRQADDLLWAMEEGLKSGAVAVVVAELSRPVALGPSRRLQLAAEAGGALGLVLCPGEAAGAPAGRISPSALATRWRVTPEPLPAGIADMAETADTADTAGMAVQAFRLTLNRARGRAGGGPVSWPFCLMDDGRLLSYGEGAR